MGFIVGISPEIWPRRVHLHSRVRKTPLFPEVTDLGDGPWRRSAEKVRTIPGVSCGEKLRWNVFFLPVNARARPVREGKRRNLTQGSPRLVPTLFEPPIRVQTGGRPRQVQFSTGKCQENARFPRLISVFEPPPAYMPTHRFEKRLSVY